jgi:hypothetical protein
MLHIGSEVIVSGRIPISEEDMAHVRWLKGLMEESAPTEFGSEIDKYLVFRENKKDQKNITRTLGTQAVVNCPAPVSIERSISVSEEKRKSFLSLPFLRRQLMPSSR